MGLQRELLEKDPEKALHSHFETSLSVDQKGRSGAFSRQFSTQIVEAVRKVC